MFDRELRRGGAGNLWSKDCTAAAAEVLGKLEQCGMPDRTPSWDYHQVRRQKDIMN